MASDRESSAFGAAMLRKAEARIRQEVAGTDGHAAPHSSGATAQDRTEAARPSPTAAKTTRQPRNHAA